MTLYDLIMSTLKNTFTMADWSMLGKGEIDDEEKIQEMLAMGYEAIS